MKILNLMILVLLLSGCCTLEKKIVKPPSIPPHTVCEENQQLLICESDKLEDCYGFLDG
jgi:uncharacterized protein YceK